jgi:hypothetical protein
MIAPSKQFGDSGYQEGGSVLETQTGDVQENVRVPSLLPKKVTRKKSAIKPSGEVVNVPPQRGALVQKRAVATIPQTPKIQGQQWAPQPRWAEPNVLPTTEEWNAQGGSDAKPITRDNARAIVTKRVIPDPKAAKKNPKTKKVKTVYDVQKPMVDQKIPGFENFGEVVKEHKETAPTRQLQILEGPITAAQDYAETIAPYKSSSGSTRATTGRVTSVVDSEETPIAPVRPTVSSQLAKIPGNSPVDLPTTPVSKGKPKGKKVLSYRENKVEVVPPAAKPKKVKEAPEQLAFPGMESTSTTHAEGQQWATAKQLGEKTLGLQAKSQTAGVPGGSNPIEVKRGTEAKKPTGSFKKR